MRFSTLLGLAIAVTYLWTWASKSFQSPEYVVSEICYCVTIKPSADKTWVEMEHAYILRDPTRNHFYMARWAPWQGKPHAALQAQRDLGLPPVELLGQKLAAEWRHGPHGSLPRIINDTYQGEWQVIARHP